MNKLLDALLSVDNINIRLLPNSPVYGYNFATPEKIETLVSRISSKLEEEISFYKNTVFPVIDTAITSIETEFERLKNINSYYPKFISFEIPEFMTTLLDTELPNPGTREREIRLVMPDRIDIESLLNAVNPNVAFQKAIKDFLLSATEQDIEDAYNAYIYPVNFSVQSTFMKRRNINELYIAVAISLLLGRNTPDGARGKLDDYRYYIEMLYYLLADKAISVVRAYMAAERNGSLVLDRARDLNKGRITAITVSPKAISTYYANGGVIEAIYGAVLLTPDDVTLEDILENGDKYIAEWASKRVAYEAEFTARKEDMIRDLYKDKIGDYLQDLELSDTTPVEGLLISFMDGKTIGELSNIQEFVEKFIVDILLRDSNASYFIRKMNYYLANNGGDKALAATSATIDLGISYLFNGVTVEKTN